MQQHQSMRLSDVIGISSSPEGEQPPSAEAAGAAPNGTVEVTVAGATHELPTGLQDSVRKALESCKRARALCQKGPTASSEPPPVSPVSSEPPEPPPVSSEPPLFEPPQTQPHADSQEPPETQPAFSDILRDFGVDVSESGIVDVPDSQPNLDEEAS